MTVDTHSLKEANFKFLGLYNNKTKEHAGNNMVILGFHYAILQSI